MKLREGITSSGKMRLPTEEENSERQKMLQDSLTKMLAENAQRRIDEQNRNIEEYKKKVATMGLFGKVRSFFSGGPKLPEYPGAAPEYEQIRNEIANRPTGFQTLKEHGAEITKDTVVSLYDYAKKAIVDRNTELGEAYKQYEKEGGKAYAQYKTQEQTAIGAAKNIGQLASSTAKIGLEFSPFSGFSGIRKIIKSVGGENVAELIDRNSPEYIKSVDGFIDDSGILNYSPKYENIIQQTGGEVAEIATWFIPITKGAKAEKIFSKIPSLSSRFGVSPRVAKVGEKFFYELSTDVLDVAVLDALRGKTIDEISEDSRLAAGGGVALRITGGTIGTILKKAKAAKAISSLEKSGFGKLSSDEARTVSNMVENKSTSDDIYARIMESRGGVVSGEVSEDAVKNSIERSFESAVTDTNKAKYEEKIKPQLDELEEPKADEVVVYSDGEMKRGGVIETDPKKALDTMEDVRVSKVNETQLTKAGIKEADETAYTTLAEPKTPSAEIKKAEVKEAPIEKAEIAKGVGENKKPEVTKTTTEEVKAQRLPQIEGTGKEKARGLYKSLVKGSADDAFIKSEDALPEHLKYNTHNQKKEKEFWSEKIANGEGDYVRRVALGEVAPPDGVTAEGALVVMKNSPLSAEDVVDFASGSALVQDATTMGQRISMLRNVNPLSASSVAEEIVSSKATKKLGKKSKEVLEETKNKFSDSVRFKIEDAEEILNSLIC